MLIKKGDIFGNWTILYQVKDNKHIKFLCKCTCGKEKIVRKQHLISKRSTRCIECKINNAVSKSKLYHVWEAMKQRTLNEKCKEYKSYGARGIDICKEWHDFIPFKNWALENGYSENLQIDRINNDKGYYPKNCRFVDRETNCNNTRRNKFYTHNKETLSISQWAKKLNISRNCLNSRLNRGSTFQEAISKSTGRCGG